MKGLLILLLVFMLISCSKSDTETPLSKEFLKKQLDFSTQQYELMSTACPDSLFPKTFEDGELKTSASNWWCSGFFPGSLVYLNEYKGDSFFEIEILKRFKYLEREKFNPENHDIGFKIYNSFGNMLRTTKDTATYSPIIIDAANTLLTRYNSDLGLIRSWDSWKDDWQYVVIIDNMMNLELLIAATEISGDSIFYNAAISHADKTLENHFREDFSSYHVVSYDTISGKPNLKVTHQGFSNESAWARGQAWGLYGFTTIYKLTGEKRYLEIANKIADFYLDHPNLPEDLIPYWDFNAGNIPNELRDASAAAISASALITLSKHTEEKGEKYFNAANKIIRHLSSPEYQAELGENGNFILKHGVGHLPGNSEVDVPLSYADYYYIESLMKLYAIN
jgi:unsaturated chondroitin disaccharide hydrolase